MKKVRSILQGVFLGTIVGLMLLSVAKPVLAGVNNQTLSVPLFPTTALTLNSSADDILAVMLESDKQWDSLVATYSVAIKNPETLSITIQENQRFWLANKGEWARVEVDGEQPTVFVRNAALIKQENRKKRIYLQSQIPGTARYDGFNPRSLISNGSGAVYLHPYGKTLPTNYYDFLYPTAIAQSLIQNKDIETLQIIGEEEVAGRKTVVIARMPKNHLYWVDATTGVILKAEYLDENSNWLFKFEAQSIDFDAQIPSSIFQLLPSNTSKLVTPSEYHSQK